MIIAQISDLHIKENGRLAYGRVDSAVALQACVDHLNNLVPRPDVALVTGDMVDGGLDAEYQWVRELLSPLQVPYYMVPGNHDDRAALRRAFADHTYLGGDGEFVHYTLDNWPLRLIGLDTTIPGHKEGVFCERRLAWLAARLAEAPERPTLLFMHHPPFLTGISHMDVQNCGNAVGLARTLAPYRQVRAMICGHVHRPVNVSWHGIAASIGPSPSHAVCLDLAEVLPPSFVVEPPACRILLWDNDTLVSHVSYIGHFDGPHPFFDQAGHLID